MSRKNFTQDVLVFPGNIHSFWGFISSGKFFILLWKVIFLERKLMSLREIEIFLVGNRNFLGRK